MSEAQAAPAQEEVIASILSTMKALAEVAPEGSSSGAARDLAEACQRFGEAVRALRGK
jgi:hypothetical protein